MHGKNNKAAEIFLMLESTPFWIIVSWDISFRLINKDIMIF